jgi:hypothetical protein
MNKLDLVSMVSFYCKMLHNLANTDQKACHSYGELKPHLRHRVIKMLFYLFSIPPLWTAPCRGEGACMFQ